MEEKYVAALDVGTSTVICIIYNSRAEVIGRCSDSVKLHFPEPGYVEINPEELWLTIVGVLKNAFKDAQLSPKQVCSLGISTHRNTFTIWDRVTGKYFHNFITWKDMRGDQLVQSWNKSFKLKAINSCAYMLYMVSRSNRFLAGSVMKMTNTQVIMRLLWVLKNNSEVKRAVQQGNAVYGTIDTWLLNKLTRVQAHITDFSNASASGMYDPFTMSWAGWAMNIVGIPKEILPRVVDTAGNFGYVEESLLGAKIPIACIMADQSASMWGSCCFNPGDVKLTMGTGSFININTGSSTHASVLGLYPVIAWKFGTETVFMVEGNNADSGSTVQWALSAGLISNPKETSALANSVEDSDGVFFIPAFSGLGPPINDQSAGAGFIGMKMSTKREHLIRSILEAIVFQAVQLYNCTKTETSYTLDSIRTDGGVSQNDFVSQLISDMTGLKLERSTSCETSCLGVGFLAGLLSGVWHSKEEIHALHRMERVFSPREPVGHAYMGVMARWMDASQRFGGWYKRRRHTNSVTPRISVKETKTLT